MQAPGFRSLFALERGWHTPCKINGVARSDTSLPAAARYLLFSALHFCALRAQKCSAKGREVPLGITVAALAGTHVRSSKGRDGVVVLIVGAL
jgi:hypothetical protein